MTTETSLNTAVARSVAAATPLEAGQVESLLQTPPDPEMGDLGLPCFPLAKELRKAPQQIAQELAEAIELPRGVERAQAFGPYLNFFIDRPWAIERVLRTVREQGGGYGANQAGAGQDVVVEYSSPNIAKHLGVHHMRGSIIGSALVRILRRCNYDVTSMNFLGDWGTGFGKLIAASERYGIENPGELTVDDLQELYVRYSSEAEGDEELEQLARDAFKRLEDGDPPAVALWEMFKKVSLDEFQRVYALLGVEFDEYSGESVYKDELQDAVDDLQEQGVAHESQGAVVCELETADGDELPPLLVQKKDGSSLYVTRDYCAAIERWERFAFDRSIYVVGNEQGLHFKQLRALLLAMGHDWAERIEHVGFGLMRFRDAQTGEDRMGSTRKGDILLLTDLLQEAIDRARAKLESNAGRLDDDADVEELARQVGIGAIIFSELSSRRNREVVFEWDRALDFEGDTGPYVQYAHARLCSILRKADESVRADADCALLNLPEEWALVQKLADLPAVVQRAGSECEPSLVANYLLELCSLFSTYYSAGMREEDLRVLCPDGQLRAARLMLVDAVRQVVAGGLSLLGLAAPKRM
jgi:arginyl-tRNA synthetase